MLEVRVLEFYIIVSTDKIGTHRMQNNMSKMTVLKPLCDVNKPLLICFLCSCELALYVFVQNSSRESCQDKVTREITF